MTTNTSSTGIFSVPALEAGAYTVSVSLSGFKTFSTDVRLAIGTTAEVKALLQVGDLKEVVNVVSSAELINTQTNTSSSTLNSDQIVSSRRRRGT